MSFEAQIGCGVPAGRYTGGGIVLMINVQGRGIWRAPKNISDIDNLKRRHAVKGSRNPRAGVVARKSGGSASWARVAKSFLMPSFTKRRRQNGAEPPVFCAVMPRNFNNMQKISTNS
jgi:hypothetical protein